MEALTPTKKEKKLLFNYYQDVLSTVCITYIDYTTEGFASTK